MDYKLLTIATIHHKLAQIDYKYCPAEDKYIFNPYFSLGSITAIKCSTMAQQPTLIVPAQIQLRLRIILVRYTIETT